MGAKTYRSWRHVIQEFSSRISILSLVSLIAVSVIPCLLFLKENKDLPEFNVYKYGVFTIFVSIMIGYSFWTTLTPLYRKNTGVWICFELTGIVLFLSFSSYPHLNKIEEKTLVFLIYFLIGLIKQVFLMLGIMYEKWEEEEQDYEKLTREFLKNLHKTAMEKIQSPDFVPRCKDFNELYKMYISKDSETRLEIPEEDFKVLEEKYLNNEFGPNAFGPVLKYSMKVIKDHVKHNK